MNRQSWTRAALLAATLAMTSASGALAQSADGKQGPPAGAGIKSAPTPMASRLDPASAGAALPAVMLPAPDTAPWIAEDQARAASGDKAFRTGVPREARVSLADGRWDAIPGEGWLWRVEFGSKGATTVRAHLTGMDLPEGAAIQMYPAGKSAPVFGPFVGRGPVGDGDLWAPPVPGERMVIEYFVPGATGGEAPKQTWVLVDQVMHDYRSPFDADVTPLEGSCHFDVTCYGAWANETHAVARISYVDAGSWVCTGQLMNAQNGDLTPYFLTADHCVHNNAAAASVTAYWDFQTSSCNGSPPSLGSVPTSSVCTLLSHNTPSDYSLLMMEGTLPGGRYWVGWENGVPSNGTFMTGIHHPTGAYKRISFGTKTTGPADHIRLLWYAGVTEGGSSGSGIFRDDNHHLVGQLHGGLSACGAPTSDLWDDYGAFSTTYGAISAFLTGGSDDGFEPDDACGAPAFIASGSWAGLIVKSGSSDWYNVFVGANQRITISLSFTHAYGDIDLQMFDGCGSLLASSTGTGNAESIDYYNTGGAKNVRVHVYLYSDTRNAYNMSVNVAAFPNLRATDTPAGFTYPVVPRKTNDAGFYNAPLPATLDGNTPDTYQNWAILSAGPGTIPTGWDARLYIDETWSWAYSMGSGLGVASVQALNLGPDQIRGGRHTLTSYADWGNGVVESSEGDNVWAGQFVWSPLTTTSNNPNVRPTPPDVGGFGLPNSDGFQFSRPGNYAWVTAIAPILAGDDFDLNVYDDYSGSLSGFSNLRGSSAYGTTATDFVVGHYSGTPTTLYPAAIRYAANAGSALLVDQSDASPRNGDGTYALWPNQLMDWYRLADVYEAYLYSGTAYSFVLGRTSGTADITFEVFPGTGGGIYGRGYAEAFGVYAGATLDTVRFTAATTGWHPVVVYRNSGDDYAPVTYNFAWGTNALVDVPTTGGPALALDFLGAAPNPLVTDTRLTFTLPQAQDVSMAIFDVNGRRVKWIADGGFSAGRHDLSWDGRDESGGRAGAGVYWARFESGGRNIARRVVVMP